jgi:hypothetical protein
MRIKSLTIITFFCALFFNFNLSAQCPTVVCVNDTTIYADSSNCGAIFNYTAPVGIDACGTASDSITFSFIADSIQQWIIPAGVTSLSIETRGAEGGFNSSSGMISGKGAVMIGDFSVTPGSSLKILVGEKPIYGNGGGGGSFVTDMSNTPLIIAGGGSGSHNVTVTASKDGNTTTSGGDGSGAGGTGGINGNGGNNNGTSSFLSGAGGGLLTDGGDGWAINTGGRSFLNGGAGGVSSAYGGFGGGGAGSGNVVGGAGGGYSGGGSGGNSNAGHGGGGGSFNSGTNQNNTTGINVGQGLVIIRYDGIPSIPSVQSTGLASGSVFPLGTTTNNFVVTDSAGNSDSCSFNVIVLDTIAPTIVCPGNDTVCNALVMGIAPTILNSCSGDTVSYTLSGATTGSGTTDASGSIFNTGLTTITYMVADVSGNQSSCSFSVLVTAPVVSITAFSPNMICDNNGSVALPTASPIGGTYSGNGVSGADFDPAISGVGTHSVMYSYTDSLGCSNSDSTNIIVIGAPVVTIAAFNPNMICENNGSVALPTASPIGGNYSGNGVSGADFDPATSGIGTHSVMYSYTDTLGCSGADSTNIIVIGAPAVTIAAFNPNMICENNGSVALPTASPIGGNYSGNGVSGADFDPATSGVGTHSVMYSYTDTLGCSGADSTNIIVIGAPAVTIAAFNPDTICSSVASLVLPTASPIGGNYSGNGVSGTDFDPTTSGVGTHSVMYSYTDSSGCSGADSTNVIVVTCSSINTIKENVAFNVYPNPNNGEFTLDLGKNTEEAVVEIYNAVGSLVYSEQVNQSKVNINLTNVAKGVYFIKIQSQKGQAVKGIVINNN